MRAGMCPCANSHGERTSTTASGAVAGRAPPPAAPSPSMAATINASAPSEAACLRAVQLHHQHGERRRRAVGRCSSDSSVAAS